MSLPQNQEKPWNPPAWIEESDWSVSRRSATAPHHFRRLGARPPRAPRASAIGPRFRQHLRLDHRQSATAPALHRPALAAGRLTRAPRKPWI